MPRRALDLRAVGLMGLLCAAWGFQQIAIKDSAASIAPVMQLALRFGGASLFFGVWVLVREGRRAFADGTLASGLLLGAAFSLEFIFAGESLVYTTASHMVVLLYTAPIFTALGLQFLPEERLTRMQWVGILLAVLGVAVAFLDFETRPSERLLTGDLLALCGAMSWGLSNVVLRRGRVSSAATTKTVFYQVATATVVLGGFASATGQSHIQLSPPVIASLAFQIAVVGIGSYFLWYWLLSQYLTSRLMLLSLATPLFGVAFGALLLDDPLDVRFAEGAVLVLAGALTVNHRSRIRR